MEKRISHPPTRQSGPVFHRPPRATSSTITRPSLRRNIVYSAIGTILRAGSQWALLVLIARKSGPTDLGAFALASATIAPIFMLSNLQLRAIQATDAGGQFSFSTIWAFRLTTSLLATAGIAAYAYLTSGRDFLHSALLVALALSAGIDALSDALHGRLQRNERLGMIAVSIGLRGILSFILPAVALAITSDLQLASFLLPLASAIVFLIIDIPATAKIPSRSSLKFHFPTRESSTRLLKSALPLGISVMLLSLTLNIPRLVLAREAGVEVLGLLAAVLQLISAGALVVSAGLQAASPRLANQIEALNLQAFRNLLRRLHLAVILIALGGLTLSLVAGRPLVSFLFGPAFNDAASLLPLLSIAGGFTFAGSVTGTALTAARLHAHQLPLALLTALTSYTSSVILIRNFGITGAAWSITITYAFKLALGQLLLQRHLSRLC